jgi:prepilin-type N-terminal cleavage/methylation domain-containing protein
MLRPQKRHENGFTLVEMAVVLTIVGLAIASVLSGKAIIEDARVTATISQVRAYDAAAITFKDIYGYMPGDLPNANNRVPGCDMTKDCNPTGIGYASAVDTDRAIGKRNWGAQGWAPQLYDQGGVINSQAYETRFFWTQLQRQGLISGLAFKDDGDYFRFGNSSPKSPLGGGFVVGYADGSKFITGGVASTDPFKGNTLVLVGSPTVQMGTTIGDQAITPAEAYKIDRRMDDGLPGFGDVQAAGNKTACYNNSAESYAETEEDRNCNLFFRMHDRR